MYYCITEIKLSAKLYFQVNGESSSPIRLNDTTDEGSGKSVRIDNIKTMISMKSVPFLDTEHGTNHWIASFCLMSSLMSPPLQQ